MHTRRQNTVALALGAAVSGLLAYLVFALTTRTLGDEAAPVSVLWTYWGFAGAAFTFPLQHWIARTVIAHGSGAVRSAGPQLAVVVAGASLITGGLAWLVRDPLFHSDSAWFPGLVALVTLGSAVIGTVRGGLSARGRFVSVSISLVAENAVRCVAVATLALADVQSPVAYGLCIVAGHGVAILWPQALRFDRERTSTERHSALEFISSAAFAQLLGQVVLTGGPVALALTGGSAAEVTALFAALALFRAPYMLGIGVASQLTTIITRLVIDGENATLRRFRRTLTGTTVAACAVAAILGAWLGPTLIPLIFGDSITFEADQSAIAVVACTLAVANLVVMIGALARDRPSGVAAAWLVAVLGAAVVFLALATLPAMDTVLWCFLAAEMIAFVTLLVAESWRSA